MEIEAARHLTKNPFGVINRLVQGYREVLRKLAFDAPALRD
jgi:hypothetical protein